MTGQRITILDTTLRDGEQSVGVAFTPDEKVEIAIALERLGVDVIEAGFPGSSPGEAAGVALVAGAVSRPIVAAMARVHVSDIEAAARALEPATRSRLHLVLPTSPIHRAAKLRMDKKQIVQLAQDAISHARSMFDEIELCCEDASRTEPDFLAHICAAAEDAGADLINLPDTVGCALPGEYARLFSRIRRSSGDAIPLAAHCHDDLGLATANTLAAVDAGAAQVECTINGIGERAGNAALEEVATALHLQGYRTGINEPMLRAVSRLVSGLSHYPVAPHKAIVGAHTDRSFPEAAETRS
jgi:2-isopropylmalate synthase